MHEISMLHMQGREGFGSCRPGKGAKEDGCTNLRLSPATPDRLCGAPGGKGEAKEAMNLVLSPVPLRKHARFALPSPPTPSLPSHSAQGLRYQQGQGGVGI